MRTILSAVVYVVVRGVLAGAVLGAVYGIIFAGGDLVGALFGLPYGAILGIISSVPCGLVIGLVTHYRFRIVTELSHFRWTLAITGTICAIVVIYLLYSQVMQVHQFDLVAPPTLLASAAAFYVSQRFAIRYFHRQPTPN
jgi:uncharacterized membrane protein